MLPHEPSPTRTFGLPARAIFNAEGLHLALLDISPDELLDPFLHETVQRLPATPSVTSVARADLDPGLASCEPAGLIFHVSRCGSTLVSQALKQHDDVVVYSEPLAVNELLLSAAGSRADRVAALRTLGAFFARHAGRPYVLKLSSWNTLFCDLVADAFPQAPWALCLRDPLEVCVSLLRSPPSWLREDKASLLSAVADLGPPTLGIEERSARFFAAFCEAARRLDPARGMRLPYTGLPDAIWTVLAPHFNLPITATAQQRMATVAQVYSKSRPAAPTAFAPDGDSKRASASAELRQAVSLVAQPAYERLCATLPTRGPSHGH